MHPKPCLWIVATPIGNLQDISLRAIEVLNEVDLIAAEDTRHSRVLMQAHGIRTPLTAYHEHNEEQKSAQLLGKLQAGQSIALVSDAGTPLISDPGYRLLTRAAAAGIPCSPVPGPCAAVAALCVSGQPAVHFHFEGFLPARGAARKQRLEALRGKPETLVIYESGRRIRATLAAMIEVMGPEREAAICRELTKQFETVLRGSLEHLAGVVVQHPEQQKGEFVVVVAGAPAQAPGQALTPAAEQLFRQLCAELPASKAARITANITGVPRKTLYALGTLD